MKCSFCKEDNDGLNFQSTESQKDGVNICRICVSSILQQMMDLATENLRAQEKNGSHPDHDKNPETDLPKSKRNRGQNKTPKGLPPSHTEKSPSNKPRSRKGKGQ